jgi:triacylglycerol lipase
VIATPRYPPPVDLGLSQALAALNGLVGEYLARQSNGLATEMGWFRGDRRIRIADGGIETPHPNPMPRVAIFAHGLMCTESIWRFPDGSDYGSKLANEHALTSLYLRYNSGLPIADNGARLSDLLDELVEHYPREIDELILVGFSMGGLVLRSACHAASERSSAWLPKVRRAIYLGTPHLGAPAERVGRVVSRVLRAIPDPYARLLGELGDLRSSGVKDLGDADLRHEDRAGQAERLSLYDPRHPVPLLPGIRHALVAATLSADPFVTRLFGDAIVPLRSATARALRDRGEATLTPDDVLVLAGRNHIDLAHDHEVYEFIERIVCEVIR